MIRALVIIAGTFLFPHAFLSAQPTSEAKPAKPAAAVKYPTPADEQRMAYEQELDRRVRLELARRAAIDKDILLWGRALFPDKFHLPYCQEMHGYFVKIREAEFTSTEAPRDHAKTTIKCFLIPIFQALEEPEKFTHYLNVQATEPKALAVNMSIRFELEQNGLLRELYGDQVGRDRWTDGQFVLKNGVIFTAVGAGQKIRGLNYRNRRPNYILVDDLYDEEDINNPDSTKKKTDWFWSSLYPARDETRPCSIHVQGTAINREDLLEQLKTKPGVQARAFQTITDEKAQKVLWPELKTFEQRVAQRALMPSLIFAREYQNERWDETSAIVKRSWLDAWEYNPADLRFDQHQILSAVLLTIDPSLGKNNEGDPSAYVLVLKIQRTDDKSLPRYYIESLWNDHLDLPKRLDLAEEIVRSRPHDRPVTEVRVEGISGFDDFARLVAGRVPAPVTILNKVPDKISHLQNKSHYFQNRRVFLNRNIDETLRRELIHQLTTNHPTHDDMRDALLHALDDESGLWRFV